MTKIKAVGVFDYYEAEIKVNNDKLYYYFKVETGKVVCYYNQIGAIKELNTYYNFQIMPGFKTCLLYTSRTEELNEYKKYVQTKKFAEEIAKDKFGLIYPDEIIFKGKK